MKLIGIGTDIVSIARIQSILNKYFDKFIKLVLSDAEQKNKINCEYVAHRWAAKEAISKAIGIGLTGQCRMKDISILPDRNGRPYVAVCGPTKLYLDSTYPDSHIQVSMSGDDYAIGMCILYNN